MKHKGFLLGHMTLELNELRKTNVQQFEEIDTLRSREACSDAENDNLNHIDSMSELSGNTGSDI